MEGICEYRDQWPQKKRKFVSIKKIPTKNQEFCEYENENWISPPKFAFGLGFLRGLQEDWFFSKISYKEKVINS